jgi:hypothetical protein
VQKIDVLPIPLPLKNRLQMLFLQMEPSMLYILEQSSVDPKANSKKKQMDADHIKRQYADKKDVMFRGIVKAKPTQFFVHTIVRFEPSQMLLRE